MNRKLSLFIVFICLLTLSILVGCGGNESVPTVTPEMEEPTLPLPEDRLMGGAVTVGTLRGPSGMGMAALMSWAEDGLSLNDYTFLLGGTPEEMTAGLISGELDIAAVPVNLASILYNRTDGEVQVISALTQSVLFVLDATGEVQSIEDLRGRTVHITGQGAIPQFAFEHILRENGLEPGVDVEIVFNAEHAELAALMVAGEVEIGLLPQPFVTAVLGQSEGAVQIALDLAAEWDAVSDTEFVQSSVVVRTAFLEAYPDTVALFLQEHAESLAFVSIYVDEAAALMEQFDIVPAAVARQVIPRSNFVYLIGADMQSAVAAFLTVIFEGNPEAIGGVMPSAAFYFLG
ncbi:MAG: ABC transporter substrate-binding protein [Oscillospiraceae bacterium]|nr:ABC transporter substrate-binding protein [Oscillospiraceae bacterium]